MAINVEAEIRDLKRRVSEIEGSFGFLTQQVQNVHKELLAFEEKTEQRFDRLEGKVDALDRKIDSVDRKIDTKIDGLAKSLPGIISDTMREVLNEKPRKKP
jgi:predicted  nucleic acid-binding Zn-ribbon protein